MKLRNAKQKDNCLVKNTSNQSCYFNCLAFPKSLFLIFLVLFFSQCKQPSEKIISPAFYLWQTEINLNSYKKSYLDALNCQKLYLKFLDIGLDGNSQKAIPLASLKILNPSDFNGKEIIPTIFITNETFLRVNTSEELEKLAQKTIKAIFELGNSLPNNQYSEIQFDCDWTGSTRQAYFIFLEKIKKHLPEKTEISATIRLHQYKFPSNTGIPPVERGMLMFYNTGDIEDIDTENSIFSVEDVKKYIIGAPKQYPKPLDIALPLFSWAIVYRESIFWKIIANPDLSEIQKNPHLQKKSEHGYQITEATLLDGQYLRPGDWLKIETINHDLLLDAAHLAQKVPFSDQITVAFFQLDTHTMQQFPPEFLKSVCDTLLFSKK
jgi:hypothetical protein